MSVKSSPAASVLAAVLGAALLGAPSASLAAGEAAPAARQAPPSISVVAAERRGLVETLAVNGTIVAREEAAVGSDLSGLAVVSLNADEGDVVKTGDILAVLDRSMLDTQLAQVEASRAQAEATIAQMRAQIGDAEVGVRQASEALERADALQKKGVATEAQRDNAAHALDSARAKLDSAEKALAASEAQLGVVEAQRQNILVQIGKTELRAPAGGLVLARDATLGSVVTPGGAPLFRIAIGGELELEAAVAETVLPRLAVGMAAHVSMPGVDHPIDGSVRRISPEIDKASRLGSIRIALEPDSPARAGNFARGAVELVRREGVAVPVSAVMYAGSDAFLQCVEDGTVKSRSVTLGARSEGMVEILSGLAEGEEVVARAGTFVADGDEVTPVRSGPAEAVGQ
ncbi:efflux RND transporter periplasmic adaptor subunit [Mesorhizobium sp. ZMM04-5]|uniref:Efflux RND transporter periplasmic adaptor subunit n=1 Tax=Mesorhizobium marinum TaxID=3228790 RepID=A0ABV3R890_9HYPH